MLVRALQCVPRNVRSRIPGGRQAGTAFAHRLDTTRKGKGLRPSSLDPSECFWSARKDSNTPGCASRRSRSGATEAPPPRAQRASGSTLRGRASQVGASTFASCASRNALRGKAYQVQVTPRQAHSGAGQRGGECRRLAVACRAVTPRPGHHDGWPRSFPRFWHRHSGAGFELRLAAPAAGLAPTAPRAVSASPLGGSNPLDPKGRNTPRGPS
jgi:hypothetical protein